MFELRPQLLDGARQAGELVSTLGIDRVTLKNAYDREAGQVLRIGRARATRYAARQALSGTGTDEFPVFRVDEDGRITQDGTFITLTADETIWLPDETILDGLPPEMHDVAPRGFLGRSFTRRHDDLGLPANVTAWSDHHVLKALTRRGEDLTGNLVIGRESFDRFQNLQPDPRTPDDFEALSNAALAGEHVGSSAGGEQPKFTALFGGQHRIIKFATSETDNARRWQDLLALEHLALATLCDAGIDAAASQLLDQNGRRYLIVDRFDRIGDTGRRAVMTMASAAEQVDGSWTDAADAMQKRGELSDESLRRVALLDAFGARIANTDRHQYNLLLFATEAGFEVAPAFDQLPMAYAPPASGNLRNGAIVEAHPTVNTLEVWEAAGALASVFWRNALELQLTATMQQVVREHVAR